MYSARWYRAAWFSRPLVSTVVATPDILGTRPNPRQLVFALWLALSALGFSGLAAYDFNGSLPDTGATRWPRETALVLDPDRPTLVYFIHPRCPCTAAGIAQLDRVLSRYAGAFRCFPVITVPPDMDRAWERGQNLDAAKRLPAARIVIDRGGDLTARFGAVHSGTLLAYAPDGTRLFAGGLTASRGHAGDSLGSLTLHDLAAGISPRQTATPVFGCPLLASRGPRIAGAPR